LLSGLSAESKKKITLCALCDSAVSYYRRETGKNRQDTINPQFSIFNLVPGWEVSTMTIRYLNPVQEAEIVPARLAPRLTSMEGITLGLLSNGKTNADKLLEMIAGELGAVARLNGVVSKRKGSAGNNCPPDLLEDMLEKCDAVVTGLGD